jgi:hypothetical protein
MGSLSKVYEISMIMVLNIGDKPLTTKLMGSLIFTEHYEEQWRIKRPIDELIFHVREKVTPATTKYLLIFGSRGCYLEQ